MRCPYITIKYAASIDGKIATSTGNSQWISSKPARVFAYALRAKHDAVLIGIGTVRADNPQLTVRRVPQKKSRQPLRIILDSRLSIPLDAHVVSDGNPTLIATALPENKLCTNKKARMLWSRGVEIVSIPDTSHTRVSLKKLMQLLHKRGIHRVLVEGGGNIITSFLSEHRVDEMIVVIAPILIGKGKDAIGDLHIKHVCDAYRMHIVRVMKKGDDVVFILRFILTRF